MAQILFCLYAKLCEECERETLRGDRFVEERGTWAAEEKRLEREVLAHSKQQQKVGEFLLLVFSC